MKGRTGMNFAFDCFEIFKRQNGAIRCGFSFIGRVYFSMMLTNVYDLYFSL